MNYTSEMCNFLREHSKDNTINDIYKMFIDKFHCDASIHGVRAKIKQLGLEFKRHEFYGSKKYGKEVVDYIKDNAEGLLNEQLAENINHTFGISITKEEVKGIKAYIGAKSGISCYDAMMMTRPDDWVNPRRGKKLSPENYEKIRKAFFKKGFNGLPPCPVGTERVRGNRIFIKIEEPDIWISKAKYVYEKETGEYLKQGEVVVLLDGSIDNFELDNLMKVSKAEVLRYNQMKLEARKNKELNKLVYSLHKLARLRRELERGKEKK